jgi:hypothetical protein
MRDLGILPGDDFESFGAALNNLDVVIGVSNNSFRRRAFVWRKSTGIQPLPIDPEVESQPTAINDFSVIVGFRNGFSGSSLEDGGFISDRLRGTRALPQIDGFRFLQPTDINNVGKLVGLAATGSSNTPFLMDTLRSKSQLLPLDDVAAINDFGRVAGSARFADLTFHAAIWDAKRGLIDLGVIPGSSSSTSRDINNAGVVVGAIGANNSLSRAMIWDSINGMRDLNDLIARTPDQSLLQLGEARGINNFGWIIANGSSDGEFGRSFLLIPRTARELARFSACAALTSGSLQP